MLAAFTTLCVCARANIYNIWWRGRQYVLAYLLAFVCEREIVCVCECIHQNHATSLFLSVHTSHRNGIGLVFWKLCLF